jgi:GTPase SAR1 family protein
VDGLLALVDAGSTEFVLVSDWQRAVSAPAATRTHANAEVLMLGDSGVGKSGLAMVLAGQEFRPTESTRGRQIWRLSATEEADSSGDTRDVLVWDLAGQPGYRIAHQLHLEGAALALILFDAKSETAPLAGVQHWARGPVLAARHPQIRAPQAPALHRLRRRLPRRDLPAGTTPRRGPDHEARCSLTVRHNR